MTPHLAAALASAHQQELERLAGCCTAAAEHRREAHRTLRDRLAAQRALRLGSGRSCCPAA